MGMSADRYREQLQALLPRGEAWPRDPGAVLTALLDALAQEFGRVDMRADNLLDELDPRTTNELLLDFERVYGLPGPCITTAQTTTERRAALVAQITEIGNLSRQYFIDLAARLGYTITITEFQQFRVGQSAVGDALYGDDWIYAWQVNAALDTINEFQVNQNAVGDPLRSWGNESLECAITARKPAHTTLIFSYQ